MISGDFKKFTGSLIGLGILALIISTFGFAAPAAGAPDPGGGGASGRANKIHGTVLNYPDGARQANMFVTIWRHDGGQFLTTRTNASGIYEFYNLDPNQKYNLVVNGIFQSGNNDCPRTCPNFRREDPSRRCAVRNDVELIDGGDGWHGENFWLEPCQSTPPPSSCQASVPSDHWRGEYFNNMNLSGNPSMVRDDQTGYLSFDWGSGSPGVDCGIGADNFSVRWTRSVYFQRGVYSFTVTADDGVRFWIDGVLKLNKWFDQAPTTYTVGPVSLSSGNLTLKVEYYEKGGGATLRLAWQQQSSCQATVPADRWKGEYFDNPSLTGYPVMVRDDGNAFLNFDWGLGTPSSTCSIPPDNFSARWTRTAYFEEGPYRFRVTGDDGVRLWIDGQLKLNEWKDQAPTQYRVVPVHLPAGNHNLKLEYYERGGGATTRLSWEKVYEWPNAVSKANSDPWIAQHHNEVYVMKPKILALNFTNFKTMPPRCGPICSRSSRP